METTRRQFGVLRLGIVLLTLATASIHFSLMLPAIDPIFTLNALGYLALLAAMFLPLPFVKDNHRLVRYVFIGYTLVTIIAWLLIGARTPIGYTAKAIEVVLIALLLLDRP